ncbi:hypothetical protein [Actinoallomurus sp. CA-142502]|uniref:hypothetical protein n=1 Tax=Actinoallomurus sp. CA-142502 TaxID=3239885 RepID=UPI003D8EE0B2
MTLIDTESAALMLGTTPNAVRIYACRYPERLPRRDRDAHGRTLYAIEDVEAILATRRNQAA